MAHKTKVNGTSYGISGGRTKINGTGYSISKGRTKVGGTGYDIAFVTLPTFTIDGTEYQYEEGMTWQDWVGSSYNTVGARVWSQSLSSGHPIIKGTDTSPTGILAFVSGGNNYPVYPTETVEKFGNTYIWTLQISNR